MEGTKVDYYMEIGRCTTSQPFSPGGDSAYVARTKMTSTTSTMSSASLVRGRATSEKPLRGKLSEDWKFAGGQYLDPA